MATPRDTKDNGDVLVFTGDKARRGNVEESVASWELKDRLKREAEKLPEHKQSECSNWALRLCSEKTNLILEFGVVRTTVNCDDATVLVFNQQKKQWIDQTVGKKKLTPNQRRLSDNFSRLAVTCKSSEELTLALNNYCSNPENNASLYRGTVTKTIAYTLDKNKKWQELVVPQRTPTITPEDISSKLANEEGRKELFDLIIENNKARRLTLVNLVKPKREQQPNANTSPYANADAFKGFEATYKKSAVSPAAGAGAYTSGDEAVAAAGLGGAAAGAGAGAHSASVDEVAASLKKRT